MSLVEEVLRILGSTSGVNYLRPAHKLPLKACNEGMKTHRPLLKRGVLITNSFLANRYTFRFFDSTDLESQVLFYEEFKMAQYTLPTLPYAYDVSIAIPVSP